MQNFEKLHKYSQIIALSIRSIMQKRCVCGKVITSQYDLCANCLKEYGYNRSEYPEWLVFMIADMKRERRQEFNIKQHEVTFSELGIND